MVSACEWRAFNGGLGRFWSGLKMYRIYESLYHKNVSSMVLKIVSTISNAAIFFLQVITRCLMYLVLIILLGAPVTKLRVALRSVMGLIRRPGNSFYGIYVNDIRNVGTSWKRLEGHLNISDAYWSLIDSET